VSVGGGNGTPTDAKICSLAAMKIMGGGVIVARLRWKIAMIQRCIQPVTSAPTAVLT
jgi:hypothetical protein